MWWLPRVRMVLARRPWLYWAMAASLAAIAGLQVWSASDDATRTRDAWGTTRAVWVVIDDAAPGRPVAAERRDYPAAMVPVAALDAAPTAPVAARPLIAGTVLAPGDLADERTVPADWVVVAIAAEHTPTLTTGDRVGLFAAGQSLCDGIVAVASSSPDAAQVEVGVPVACAAQVSVESPTGALTVARHP